MSAGRVLVTGAYGFTGTAYCAHLAATGVDWIGAVRARRPGDSRNEIVEAGDFAQADWESIFARVPIHAIVHLAARAHRIRDDAADIHAEYRRQNVKVTDRLSSNASGVTRARSNGSNTGASLVSATLGTNRRSPRTFRWSLSLPSGWP